MHEAHTIQAHASKFTHPAPDCSKPQGDTVHRVFNTTTRLITYVKTEAFRRNGAAPTCTVADALVGIFGKGDIRSMRRINGKYLGLARTVYGRLYGNLPARNIVYTPYIRMYVWFWPSLVISSPFPQKDPQHSCLTISPALLLHKGACSSCPK